MFLWVVLLDSHQVILLINVKVFETKNACDDGAVEIDMVINIGKALQGDWNYIEKEIKAVTNACHKNNAIVKVIFETDYVSKKEDIIKLCEICTKVNADYVKTSSGFGFVKGDDGKYSYEGATIPNLELMKKSVGPKVKSKSGRRCSNIGWITCGTKCGMLSLWCNGYNLYFGGSKKTFSLVAEKNRNSNY